MITSQPSRQQHFATSEQLFSEVENHVLFSSMVTSLFSHHVHSTREIKHESLRARKQNSRAEQVHVTQPKYTARSWCKIHGEHRAETSSFISATFHAFSAALFLSSYSNPPGQLPIQSSVTYTSAHSACKCATQTEITACHNIYFQNEMKRVNARAV